MDFRNLINKLDAIDSGLLEATTLQQIQTQLQGKTSEQERAKILNDIARKENLPGLFDPDTGAYVERQDASDTVDVSNQGDPEVARQLATLGLLPQSAQLEGPGWFDNDETYRKSHATMSATSAQVNFNQVQKKLYDLLGKLRNLNLSQPVKESIAKDLVESFGYGYNDNHLNEETLNEAGIMKAIGGFLSKLNLPLTAAYAVTDAAERMSNLPNNLTHDEKKRQFYKIFAQVVSDIGLIPAGAIIGSILFPIAGTFVGSATALFAQLKYGEQIEKFVGDMFDKLYPPEDATTGASSKSSEQSPEELGDISQDQDYFGDYSDQPEELGDANLPPNAELNPENVGFDNVSTTMLSDMIKNVQTSLNMSGSKIATDGIIGPQTFKSIQDYKKKNNYSSDIEAISDLVSKLQAGSEPVSTVAEMQYLKNTLARIDESVQIDESIISAIAEIPAVLKSTIARTYQKLRGIYQPIRARSGIAAAERAVQRELGNNILVGKEAYEFRNGAYVARRTGATLSTTQAMERGAVSIPDPTAGVPRGSRYDSTDGSVFLKLDNGWGHYKNNKTTPVLDPGTLHFLERRSYVPYSARERGVIGAGAGAGAVIGAAERGAARGAARGASASVASLGHDAEELAKLDPKIASALETASKSSAMKRFLKNPKVLLAIAALAAGGYYFDELGNLISGFLGGAEDSEVSGEPEELAAGEPEEITVAGQSGKDNGGKPSSAAATASPELTNIVSQIKDTIAELQQYMQYPNVKQDAIKNINYAQQALKTYAPGV